MKLKELSGFKIGQIVYIKKENRWAKIARIDGHVYPICIGENGLRYLPADLDHGQELNRSFSNEKI